MKLIKNYLYNAFYQLFVLIVPLITMPYIARVLGPTGAGINSFTNSNTQYFILLGSVGVSMYANRQIAYNRDNKEKASQIFWEVFFMRMFTILAALLLFYGFVYFNNSYRSEYMLQSVLIIAAAFDISWFFMGIENFQVTVLRNILVRMISLICVFVFVKTKDDLLIYIGIIVISQLLGNLTLFPYLRNHVNKINWKSLKIWKHLKPSLVLFVPQIATQVYLILNKTMLGTMVSVEATGFYDYSDKIIKMVLAIVTATGTVMLPRVANTFAKGDFKKVNEYLYSSFDFVSSISIPMMFGIAAIAPKFAPMFFGRQFSEVSTLMIVESVVILFIAWSNVLGVQYLLPTGRNREFTISVTIGAMINIILNVPLIMYLGTEGAMISTVISELGVTIYQLYVLKGAISRRSLFDGIWKYILSGLVMYVAVSYLIMNFHITLINLMLIVLLGGVIYFIGLLITKAQIISDAKNLISRRQ